MRNRTILRFLPVTRYFFGKNFSRADLAGAREWNMKRNDVILGVLNFFGYQSGGSVGVVGCIARAWQHGLKSRQKTGNYRLSINPRAFHRQPPGHGQVPNDPSDPQKNSVAAGGAMQGRLRTLRDSACSCPRNGTADEKAVNAISPGGDGVDGHGDYTYSSSYTKNDWAPPHSVRGLTEPFSTAMLAF